MKLHNNNMNQRDIIDLVDQLFEIDRSKRSIIVGAVNGHNHVPQIRIRDVLKVAAGVVCGLANIRVLLPSSFAMLLYMAMYGCG